MSGTGGTRVTTRRIAAAAASSSTSKSSANTNNKTSEATQIAKAENQKENDQESGGDDMSEEGDEEVQDDGDDRENEEKKVNQKTDDSKNKKSNKTDGPIVPTRRSARARRKPAGKGLSSDESVESDDINKSSNSRNIASARTKRRRPSKDYNAKSNKKTQRNKGNQESDDNESETGDGDSTNDNESGMEEKEIVTEVSSKRKKVDGKKNMSKNIGNNDERSGSDNSDSEKEGNVGKKAKREKANDDDIKNEKNTTRKEEADRDSDDTKSEMEKNNVGQASEREVSHKQGFEKQVDDDDEPNLAIITRKRSQQLSQDQKEREEVSSSRTVSTNLGKGSSTSEPSTSTSNVRKSARIRRKSVDGGMREQSQLQPEPESSSPPASDVDDSDNPDKDKKEDERVSSDEVEGNNAVNNNSFVGTNDDDTNVPTENEPITGPIQHENDPTKEVPAAPRMTIQSTDQVIIQAQSRATAVVPSEPERSKDLVQTELPKASHVYPIDSNPECLAAAIPSRKEVSTEPEQSIVVAKEIENGVAECAVEDLDGTEPIDKHGHAEEEQEPVFYEAVCEAEAGEEGMEEVEQGKEAGEENLCRKTEGNTVAIVDAVNVAMLPSEPKEQSDFTVYTPLSRQRSDPELGGGNESETSRATSTTSTKRRSKRERDLTIFHDAHESIEGDISSRIQMEEKSPLNESRDIISSFTKPDSDDSSSTKFQGTAIPLSTEKEPTSLSFQNLESVNASVEKDDKNRICDDSKLEMKATAVVLDDFKFVGDKERSLSDLPRVAAENDLEIIFETGGTMRAIDSDKNKGVTEVATDCDKNLLSREVRIDHTRNDEETSQEVEFVAGKEPVALATVEIGADNKEASRGTAAEVCFQMETTAAGMEEEDNTSESETGVLTADIDTIAPARIDQVFDDGVPAEKNDDGQTSLADNDNPNEKSCKIRRQEEEMKKVGCSEIVISKFQSECDTKLQAPSNHDEANEVVEVGISISDVKSSEDNNMLMERSGITSISESHSAVQEGENDMTHAMSVEEVHNGYQKMVLPLSERNVASEEYGLEQKKIEDIKQQVIVSESVSRNSTMEMSPYAQADNKICASVELNDVATLPSHKEQALAISCDDVVSDVNTGRSGHLDALLQSEVNTDQSANHFENDKILLSGRFSSGKESRSSPPVKVEAGSCHPEVNAEKTNSAEQGTNDGILSKAEKPGHEDVEGEPNSIVKETANRQLTSIGPHVDMESCVAGHGESQKDVLSQELVASDVTVFSSSIDLPSKSSNVKSPCFPEARIAVEPVQASGDLIVVDRKGIGFADARQMAPEQEENMIEPERLVVKKTRIHLEKVKLVLFAAGKRVHRCRGYERLFSEYWDALSLRIEGNLSSLQMRRCRSLLDTFLKTKGLKKLHNKLIMGLLARCIEPLTPLREISSVIPTAWQSRIKIVKPLPAEEVAETNLLLSREQEEANLLSAKIQYCTPVLKEMYPAQLKGLVEMPRSSLRIPGALIVDPLVRALAQGAGLNVSENAIWVLVIAIKEYTKSLLDKTINFVKEIEDGHTATGTNSQIVSPDRKRASLSIRKDSSRLPTTVISARHIHALTASLPTGAARSLSNRVSRITFERSLHTSNRTYPTIRKDEYDAVKKFVAGSIMAPAPKRRNVDVKTSALTTSKDLYVASSPLTHSSTLASSSVPAPVSSTEPTVVSSIAHARGIGSSTAPTLKTDDQSKVPAQTTINVGSGNTEPPLAAAPPAATLAAPNLGSPAVVEAPRPRTPVRGGLGRGAKDLASLKLRSKSSVVAGSKDNPGSPRNTSAGSPESAVVSLAQDATPASKPSTTQSPDPIPDQSSLSSQGRDTAGTGVEKKSLPDAATSSQDRSEVAESSSLDDPVEASSSSTPRRGKGFGVKNLAAMKARKQI